MRRLLAPALALLAAPALAAPPAPPLAALTVVGPPEIVFSPKRDACDGHDVADAPARAYRDARGHVVLFALHYQNRALRGPSLDALKIDCAVVLASGSKSDPALYDDKSWITATWTEDGTRVDALVHHEFQANHHPGRCRFKEYMACWYNTVLAVSSTDGGARFARPGVPAVVAAAPFPQEVDQGRHRGFFNPSNIVGDGPWRYMFAATTGWDGQPHGACLFRSPDPADPGSWRAHDGTDFTIRYRDPHAPAPAGKGGAGAAAKAVPKAAPAAVAPCRPVAPFPAPVGGVVRHRGTGAWIAVFQASADGSRFPEAGIYTTSSRDLLAWDKPRLLLAGRTNYDDACTSGGRLIAYPSLIDRRARGRNFDDVGDEAELYYADLKVEGCTITGDRSLVRRRVAIKVWP